MITTATAANLQATDRDLADARNLALRAGSLLTIRKDIPDSVLNNAAPIEAWLLAAADLDDLTARSRAVRLHVDNLKAMHPGEPEELATDETDGFLCAVQRYHLRITGAEPGA